MTYTSPCARNQPASRPQAAFVIRLASTWPVCMSVKSISPASRITGRGHGRETMGQSRGKPRSVHCPYAHRWPSPPPENLDSPRLVHPATATRHCRQTWLGPAACDSCPARTGFRGQLVRLPPTGCRVHSRDRCRRVSTLRRPACPDGRPGVKHGPPRASHRDSTGRAPSAGPARPLRRSLHGADFPARARRIHRPPRSRAAPTPSASTTRGHCPRPRNAPSRHQP